MPDCKIGSTIVVLLQRPGRAIGGRGLPLSTVRLVKGVNRQGEVSKNRPSFLSKLFSIP